MPSIQLPTCDDIMCTMLRNTDGRSASSTGWAFDQLMTRGLAHLISIRKRSATNFRDHCEHLEASSRPNVVGRVHGPIEKGTQSDETQ